MNDLSDVELSDDDQQHNRHWSQNAIGFDSVEDAKVRGFINGDSIMKITLVVTFVAEFARAIENVWITALMMQYSINPYFDCFAWSLPVFISIVAKPFIQNYVSRFIVSVSKYIDQLFVYLVVGAGGHYLVAASTFVETMFNFSHFPIHFSTMRILVAVLGWTIIDVTLELTLTYNDNIKAYLIENKINKQHDSRMRKYQESMTMFAKVSGYVLSLVICSPPFTFRLDNMYYVSGLMWINIAFFIKTVSIIRISKGIEIHNQQNQIVTRLAHMQQTLREVRIFRTETYFYGLEDTMKANFKLKMILTVFFCFNAIADITEFYAVTWMILHLRSSTLTYAGIYIRGISFGSFLLACSSFVTYYYKRRNRPSQIGDGQHSKQAIPINFGYRYLVCITLNILVTCYALLTSHIISLLFVIVMEGWLRGMSQLYIEKRYEMLSKFYPQFQRCQQFVFTSQKIFVLLVMPLYCWFIQGMRATEGSLWTSAVLLIIMFLIQAGELIKTKKENSNLINVVKDKKTI